MTVVWIHHSEEEEPTSFCGIFGQLKEGANAGPRTNHPPREHHRAKRAGVEGGSLLYVSCDTW
jgi:hypothetical protein